MNERTLWSSIESRLDTGRPQWRERVDELSQLEAVERRLAGRTWSDDEVFKGVLLAVLSANTDWSKIEKIMGGLADLFSGFGLESYATLSSAEIDGRILPWFLAQKAGSRSLGQNLHRLRGAARILLEHSRAHGTADDYFTSLLHRCDGDPKRAALHLGGNTRYKLPSLGVALAAEALKNLGFDVAKPDRHINRAVLSFGLVRSSRWEETRDERDERATLDSNSRKFLLAVMTAMQEIAEAAGEPVVLVDNAVWLLCAKSGLHLTNTQLAELAPCA